MAKKIIKDNRGQWAHPGRVTQIQSNNITMKGVNYPVLGVSDSGHTQLMLPGQDYKFDGNVVTEFPIMKKGKKAQQGTILPIDNEMNTLRLKNALQLERNQKRDSVRTVLKKQYPAEQYPHKINEGMIQYYRNEPIEYSTLNPSLLNEDRKKQLLNNYKPLKSGGKLKGKKAQDGFSMSDINPTDAAPIELESNVETPYMYGIPGQEPTPYSSQPRNQSNFFNKIGGANGIAQGINAVGNGINAQRNNQTEGGPSGAQQMVGQFGPWGAAISQVSQIGTNLTNKSNNVVVSTAGTTILDPAAAWTNKDLSSKDRIIGGLNPIYGGIKAHQAKKLKKEKADKLKNLLDTAGALKDPEANKRKYVRPEDQLVDPGEMFPTYGVGTNYLKEGGSVPYMKSGGELKTYNGGDAEVISQNRYLPDQGETVMFKGKSHEQGGIDIKFGNTPVEVEGGEPAVKLPDGKGESLIVFGDMKIPSYGVSELNDPKAKNKKFKSYIKELSIQEDKQNKIVDKSLKLINNTPVADSFDKLKVSSGEAMLIGTDMRLKQIANKKQTAASIQNAILETAEEMGLKSSELTKGKFKKAKNGAKIMSYQDGGNFTIPRSKVDEYRNYGYMPDPEDVNRLYREIQSAGSTQTISLAPPGKGSEDFNKAFGDARRQGLDNFNFKGKPYTTDLYKERTKTITNPGSTTKDYIYIKDDPMGEVAQTVAQTPQQSTTSAYTEQVGKVKFPWMNTLVNSVLPFIRPTDQLPFDPLQIRGEEYALANNQQEPVPAQQYHPLLENVSDISLQDQLNENQADFNSLKRLTADNPAAQASLAAQKYRANSSVLGEQFRLNQTQKMGVYNRNRGVLNDATLKNLGIMDQQYVRQSTAKSNTKAVAQAAITSIADKMAKNKLENRTLGIYENLYNYRYDNSGRAINMNPLVDFTSMIQNAVSDGAITVDENGQIIVNETKVKKDQMGTVTGSTETQRVTDLPPGYRGTTARTRGNGGVVKSIKSY